MAWQPRGLAAWFLVSLVMERVIADTELPEPSDDTVKFRLIPLDITVLRMSGSMIWLHGRVLSILIAHSYVYSLYLPIPPIFQIIVQNEPIFF